MFNYNNNTFDINYIILLINWYINVLCAILNNINNNSLIFREQYFVEYLIVLFIYYVEKFKMSVWFSFILKARTRYYFNLFYDKDFSEFGQPEKTKETEMR